MVKKSRNFYKQRKKRLAEKLRQAKYIFAALSAGPDDKVCKKCFSLYRGLYCLCELKYIVTLNSRLSSLSGSSQAPAEFEKHQIKEAHKSKKQMKLQQRKQERKTR